jgi:hypothetical protein
MVPKKYPELNSDLWFDQDKSFAYYDGFERHSTRLVMEVAYEMGIQNAQDGGPYFPKDHFLNEYSRNGLYAYIDYRMGCWKVKRQQIIEKYAVDHR